MQDRILQIWFKAVALAAIGPPPATPHVLNKEEKKYIKKLYGTTVLNDATYQDCSTTKGFEVIGETASLNYFYLLASQSKYCSSTGVFMAFNKSNPSKEPFTLSFNRKRGSEGPSRCKPTEKHLHYEGNLDVVCRALNLAKGNFTTEQIQRCVDWIIECWTIAEVFSHENPDFAVEEDVDESDEDSS